MKGTEEMEYGEDLFKKSRRKLLIISLIVILVLIVLIISGLAIKKQIEFNKIKIELKQSEVKLEYGEKIDPYGLLSKYAGGEISIENNIDFEKVGEYKIIYKVTSKNGLEKAKEIPVIIKDEIKPIITLDNDNIEFEIDNEIDVLAGVKAEDNYDKDITDKIVVTGEVDNKTEGTYEIKYDVKDSSNNVAETKTRIYTIKKKPTLQIGKTYKWEDETSGSTITLKEENQVHETAWVKDGGVSEYTGSYQIDGDKLIISLTMMQDHTGEWMGINGEGTTYTITAENQFEANGHIYVISE